MYKIDRKGGSKNRFLGNYLNWHRDSDFEIRYNQKDSFNSSNQGSPGLKTKSN